MNNENIYLFVDENDMINVEFNDSDYPLLSISDVKDMKPNEYTELLSDKVHDLFKILNRKNKIKKIFNKIND